MFNGEIMKCEKCGKTQCSDPNTSSNWLAILDSTTGNKFYFCETCSDATNQEEFTILIHDACKKLLLFGGKTK